MHMCEGFEYDGLLQALNLDFLTLLLDPWPWVPFSFINLPYVTIHASIELIWL